MSLNIIKIYSSSSLLFSPSPSQTHSDITFEVRDSKLQFPTLEFLCPNSLIFLFTLPFICSTLSTDYLCGLHFTCLFRVTVPNPSYRNTHTLSENLFNSLGSQRFKHTLHSLFSILREKPLCKQFSLIASGCRASAMDRESKYCKLLLLVFWGFFSLESCLGFTVFYIL